VSDPIALALIQHLVRTEQFDADDIASIAELLEAKGRSAEAHLVMVQMVEAAAPSQSEWEADQRRSRFRVIKADGGNSD